MPIKDKIVARVWPLRNDYVHKATDAFPEDATCAIHCLESLLSEVVDPLGQRLGFTRKLSGSWSVVVIENPPDFPGLNPPRSYEPKSPFEG